MVDKKLNYHQPILSVRRCSLKTDEAKTKNVVPRLQPLNSGPVRNPGAVPFQWEQIPGKPKVAEVYPPSRSPNISDNEMKDEEDCDESLVDEIDALSRTESFVSSRSASSLNGADDGVDGHDQTVKKEKPGFWYRPSFAKSCVYYNDKEEKQVCDDNDSDVDQHEKLVTVCCLFPRSCLKSSACFVNPVPATSVMARFAVFPSTRILSGCSSADSLSETENEDTVKSVVETDDELGENKSKANVAKDIAQLESCDGALSFGSCKNSIKTLQELLADEDSKKEMEATSGDHLNIMSLADKKPKPFGRDDEDLYVDSRKKRIGKNGEKQKLPRATTLGNSIPQFPVPPPLPRSPSDSWLFRTISTKKPSSPSFISRCTNK